MPVAAAQSRMAARPGPSAGSGFELRWPPKVKRTPARIFWFGRLGALPAGLDLRTLAQALGTPYSTARRWAFLFGYPITDLRCRGGPRDKWDGIDWALTDSQIARQLGVSRERVRQVRKQQGLPPSTGKNRPVPSSTLAIPEPQRRAV